MDKIDKVDKNLCNHIHQDLCFGVNEVLFSVNECVCQQCIYPSIGQPLNAMFLVIKKAVFYIYVSNFAQELSDIKKEYCVNNIKY